MPDEFNLPALRISNIVHGRRNVAGRVEYMLDPKGQDTSRCCQTNENSHQITGAA
jgi:hypothetical protein